MQIRLNYTSIIEKITRSLSIIGKRARNDSGDSLYEDITFGNNEYPLLQDFVRSGALKITSAMREFVDRKSDDGSDIVIYYTMPSAIFFASFNEESLQQAAEDYIASYALMRWFSFVLPSQTEFYSSDAAARLSDLTAMLYESGATHTDVSVKSITSES